MHDTTSLTTLQIMAEQGNANAQFTLGQKYEKGDGVPKNDQQAMKWYRKAAEKDDCDAQFSLARLYEEGSESIPQSYQQAITWYKKAAEQGDADAMRRLARIYEQMGSAANAFYWYQRLHYGVPITKVFDEVTAQYLLGNLYATGDGVTQDTQLAKEWLHKAMNVAEDGWDFRKIGDAFKALHDYHNADLCYQKATADLLGFRFSISQKYATGDGVTQDTQLAKEWLHKAIDVAKNGRDFERIGNAFKALHDYPNAVLWYQKAAEDNHFDSRLTLSNLYATGDGVTQDTQQAKEWLQKAINVATYGWEFDSIGDAFKALHDYPNAVLWYQKAAEDNWLYGHLTLSELYATGDGVTQDTQLAKEWLHKAINVAEDGFDFRGIGDGFKALHDYPNAVLWYQKAAENNDCDSHLTLSNLYATGDGVTQDTQQAKEWLQKAINVATYGWEFDSIGDAFKALHDYPNAVLWYQKAAEDNWLYGHLTLSELYATGDGVTQNIQLAKEWLHKAINAKEHHRYYFSEIGDAFKTLHDYPNAVLWYQKASEKNDANAQFGLGELYENGQGVTQDEEQAVLWYQKAAEQNHEAAQTALERIKARNTNANTPKTNRQKVSEYRKAAEQGDALAQFHLGQMYESGKGIPQNYVLAYAWLSVAVANEISEPTDHELAIQLRDEVGQKLPPHALSEAQQLAAQYFEQYAADE